MENQHIKNIISTLGEDLLLYIFDISLITDKRHLIRTCKHVNQITKKLMVEYDKTYVVEKFTLELFNDKYFNMLPDTYIIPNNKVIIELLSINGMIPLLEVAKKNGCDLERVPEYAITVGNIELLEWGINNNIIISFMICNHAVANNQLSIIQLLIDRKYEFTKDGYAIAALNGHISTLELLYKNNIPFGRDNGANISINAAICGKIEALEWLREKGCVWDIRICSSAAKLGHYKLLKWLYTNGCILDNDTIVSAARGGHLKIIKWLLKNGCVWNDNIIAHAALFGHLDILIWAYDNGYGLDVDVCQFATLNNHSNIIKWYRQKFYGK